jgi:hypothetical protein
VLAVVLCMCTRLASSSGALLFVFRTKTVASVPLRTTAPYAPTGVSFRIQRKRNGMQLQMGVYDMNPAEDYYAILGLRPSCTLADIHRMYRNLSFKLHPDVTKDKASGERLMPVHTRACEPQYTCASTIYRITYAARVLMNECMCVYVCVCVCYLTQTAMYAHVYACRVTSLCTHRR